MQLQLWFLALRTHSNLQLDAVPGEYLVKYKGESFAALTSIKGMGFVRIMENNTVGHILKVKVSPVEEIQTLARLSADSNVQYVVPNTLVHAFRAPLSIQALKDQWAIKKINAEAAWTRAGNRGSHNVLLAVIDTGVDYNHASLKGNTVPGYDFKDNTTDPMDQTGQANPGHGTHCSGIIGANGLVEGGTIGVSPEISIMPLRFLGADGSGDLNAAIKAIDYAIEKKVQVISASWGATVKRAQAMPLVEAVKRASDAGVIFVSAAANDGSNNDKTDVFPANAIFDNTITVAASGNSDEKPSWSNYGRRTVHLSSPGLNIMSTLPKNNYGSLSGTSMATPLVAGLVGFLKAQDSTLTGAQTRALLQQTGAKVQIETTCNCRIDAAAATETLVAHKMFITPAAGAMHVGDTQKFEGTHGKAPFTFAVTNASVASISADGIMTASAPGETTVSVKDADGQSVTSLNFLVEAKSNGGGGDGGDDDGGGFPNPGNPGDPGGGNCPFGDQATCDAICQIQPTLPFCKK